MPIPADFSEMRHSRDTVVEKRNYQYVGHHCITCNGEYGTASQPGQIEGAAEHIACMEHTSMGHSRVGHQHETQHTV